MATAVILPKVDMDQETGAISAWHKREGETVEQGKPLLTIETNKVSIEVEAPASGVLHILKSTVGEVLPIGTVIGQILKPGESLPVAALASGGAELPRSAEVAATRASPVTPVAKKLAAELGVDVAKVVGSGPRGKVTTKDVQAAVQSPAVSGTGKVNATPAARRLAREETVDLRAVAGSGPGGRVQAADVLAAASARQVAALEREPVAPVVPVVPLAEAAEADEIIPLAGMRRTIAERLTASYQMIPHITFTARVDMMRFNAARAELNAHVQAAGGTKISVTALLVKMVAQMLKQHPWLNSSLTGDEIRLRKEINLGVAVALESGLIVPVVRQADRKGLSALAAEVDDLAARARAGRLTPGDVSGGTFTLSNLGPFGVEQFTAIINPPQAAILAVGATQMEAVPVADGQVVARPVMRMTLSVDHRIVDGAVAGRFLAELKAVLETPTLLLL